MAVVASSALYGTGVYGGSTYGTRNVSFALTGVAGTGAIEPVAAGGFEIDISERLGSVSATGTINTVTVNIQEDISGVSATGSVNTVGIGNSTALTGVSTTGGVGTLTISNTVKLTGVAGTGAIEAVSAGGFEVDISEKLSSVSATGSIGTVQPVVSFFITLTGVSGTAQLGSIEAKTEEKLGSVQGTTSVGTIKLNTGAGLTSVPMFVKIKPVSVTIIQFDYEAVAHLYSQRRTVTLPTRAA